MKTELSHNKIALSKSESLLSVFMITLFLSSLLYFSPYILLLFSPLLVYFSPSLLVRLSPSVLSR